MVLTLEDIRLVLHNYSKYADFVSYKVTPFSDEVAGFLGDHYNLEITYSLNACSRKANFFVKTIPIKTNQHLEYVQTVGFFKKEVTLYEDVLPHLRKYFSKTIIPDVYLTKPDSFIVLEDLKWSGYETLKGDLTIEHCFSLMETMAKFHSASIIFEEKQSNANTIFSIHDRFGDALFETFFVQEPGHPRQIIFENSLKAIIDVIHLSEYKDNKRMLKNLERFARNEVTFLIKPSGIYRNTLAHCDLWRNNAMFRRNKFDDTIECRLIDFQFVRYVPPAWDLLLTLHLNCRFEFLEKNMDELLAHYFSCFKKNLNLHHINPAKIMDKHVFIESLNTYRPIALLEALFCSTMAFIDKDLSKRIISNEEIFEEYTYKNRSKYVSVQFMSNDYFKQRFIDILLPAVKCFENIN